MSKGAGYYSDRLTLLTQSTSVSGKAGAVAETFTEGDTLWCRIEDPKGGDKIYWSALQSAVDCMVRIRGDMGVRTVDRLKDPDDDTVYVINGVNFIDDDQICACVQFTEQVSAGVP